MENDKMSRLDSNVAEANRLAFIKDQEAIRQAEITAKWLKDNPHIGTLNNRHGVRFYFFNEDNDIVIVEQPNQ
jgi:hypothetical protein|tara:strand:- start:550 stop:768 length:219 start_codon:yes stop_codon:yes gene_type:complete